MATLSGEQILYSILNAIFNPVLECNLEAVMRLPEKVREEALDKITSQLSDILEELTVKISKNKEAGELIKPLQKLIVQNSFPLQKKVKQLISGGGMVECVADKIRILRGNDPRYMVTVRLLKGVMEGNTQSKKDSIETYTKQLEEIDKEFKITAEKDCSESFGSKLLTVASKIIEPAIIVGIPAAAAYGLKKVSDAPVTAIANIAGLAGGATGYIFGSVVGALNTWGLTNTKGVGSNWGTNLTERVENMGDGALILIFVGLFSLMLTLSVCKSVCQSIAQRGIKIGGPLMYLEIQGEHPLQLQDTSQRQLQGSSALTYMFASAILNKPSNNTASALRIANSNRSASVLRIANSNTSASVPSKGFVEVIDEPIKKQTLKANGNNKTRKANSNTSASAAAAAPAKNSQVKLPMLAFLKNIQSAKRNKNASAAAPAKNSQVHPHMAALLQGIKAHPATVNKKTSAVAAAPVKKTQVNQSMAQPHELLHNFSAVKLRKVEQTPIQKTTKQKSALVQAVEKRWTQMNPNNNAASTKEENWT